MNGYNFNFFSEAFIILISSVEIHISFTFCKLKKTFMFLFSIYFQIWNETHLLLIFCKKN
jgi:hypothetical protein